MFSYLTFVWFLSFHFHFIKWTFQNKIGFRVTVSIKRPISLYENKKPSNSATPFGTSTIHSVLTMWTLEITSAQFTRRNWNLRTLPHHLLKCVISTLISRLATTHLSVSASTIRERTLHFGLSTFLIWTATFPPIQLTVFIYLNWWDMLEFARPKLTS